MDENNRNDLEISQRLSLEAGKVSWSRRDFVTSSIATGFALAAQPIAAQTVIKTDSKGLNDGEVGIPTKDGSIPAYVAMPAKGRAFPTILVVQEIFGLHEHIQDVCRRFAKAGYLAAAPDLYYRHGDPSQMPDNKAIFAEIVSKVTYQEIMSDLDATVTWARDMGMAHRDRLGITGFCWGGGVVWVYAAHNPRLKAGVAWYGALARPFTNGPSPLDIADKVRAPVLGLYGSADAGIPLDQVERMREGLQKGRSGSTIHVYPGAPHGFHADYRPSYRKEAATNGWKRALAWFKKHGVG